MSAQGAIRSDQSSTQTKSQGSWQKIISSRHGKDHILVPDNDLQVSCAQAVEVVKVTGSLEREGLVIQQSLIPNG